MSFVDDAVKQRVNIICIVVKLLCNVYLFCRAAEIGHIENKKAM